MRCPYVPSRHGDLLEEVSLLWHDLGILWNIGRRQTVQRCRGTHRDVHAVVYPGSVCVGASISYSIILIAFARRRVAECVKWFQIFQSWPLKSNIDGFLSATAREPKNNDRSTGLVILFPTNNSPPRGLWIARGLVFSAVELPILQEFAASGLCRWNGTSTSSPEATNSATVHQPSPAKR